MNSINLFDCHQYDDITEFFELDVLDSGLSTLGDPFHEEVDIDNLPHPLHCSDIDHAIVTIKPTLVGAVLYTVPIETYIHPVFTSTDKTIRIYKRSTTHG